MFIRHRRSKNSPATTQNFLDKFCLFPVRALPFHNNSAVTLQYSPATPILKENPDSSSGHPQPPAALMGHFFHIVWFQKISIPRPQKGLEIPEGRGSRVQEIPGGAGINNISVFSRPTGSIISICSIFVCLHFAPELWTQNKSC